MLRTYKTPKGTELPLLNLRGREYLEVKYRLVWFREDHPDWAIETELLSVTDDSAYGRAVIKDQLGRIIATSHKFETKKGFPDFIEKAETGAIGRALALIGYGTQFCADELDEGSRLVDAPIDRDRQNSRSSNGPARAKEASARQPQAVAAHAQPAARTKRVDVEPVRAAEPARAPEKVAAKSAEPVKAEAKPEPRPEARAEARSEMKDPGEYQIEFGKKYKGMKLRDVPRNELEGYLEWLEDAATKKGMPLSEEARFLKVAVSRFLEQGAKH